MNVEQIDAATVISRLEEAGRTLLALPSSGFSTRLRTFNQPNGCSTDLGRAHPRRSLRTAPGRRRTEFG